MTKDLSMMWLLLLIAFGLCGAHTEKVDRKQLRSIKSHMDPTADPCVDFHQYACGNWRNEHASADYEETIGLIDHKVNQEFVGILKSARGRASYRKHKFLRNVLGYYRACNSISEYDPMQYLQWLSKHERLKWPTPLPGKNSSDDYDWLKLLATLRKYGFNGVLLEQMYIQDRENGQRMLIDIDKPVLNGGFRPLEFTEYMLMMQYLRVPAQKSLETLMLWKKILVFEAKLQELDEEEDDVGPQQVAVKQLKLPWLKRYLLIITEAPVDHKMEVIIQNIPYMRALFTELGKYDSEFIARYLLIRFLIFIFVDGPRNFYPTDCVAHTRSAMPIAMNYLYEQSNPILMQEAPKVEALFRNLLEHFNGTLHANANSFDAEVLEFLSDKLEGMRIKVSNLPRPDTVKKLEEHYQSLRVNSSDFYANHLQALIFNTRRKNLLLRSNKMTVSENFFYLEDHDTGSSSSPYFLLRRNIVIVPLTLLRLPIYDAKAHDIFKYSSLGFLLAHELVHAFDDSGVDFDQLGNMRGPSETIKANILFDKNLSCLRSKNPYIIDEKIADVSGLRLVYETYFRNATGLSAWKPGKGSEHTAKSLFFLNFAQFFCGSADDESDKYLEHGPDRQRVIDALSNFAEFAVVYDCPLGVPMHPPNKCQLWR